MRHMLKSIKFWSWAWLAAMGFWSYRLRFGGWTIFQTIYRELVRVETPRKGIFWAYKKRFDVPFQLLRKMVYVARPMATIMRLHLKIMFFLDRFHIFSILWEWWVENIDAGTWNMLFLNALSMTKLWITKQNNIESDFETFHNGNGIR